MDVSAVLVRSPSPAAFCTWEVGQRTGGSTGWRRALGGGEPP